LWQAYTGADQKGTGGRLLELGYTSDQIYACNRMYACISILTRVTPVARAPGDGAGADAGAAAGAGAEASAVAGIITPVSHTGGVGGAGGYVARPGGPVTARRQRP